MKRLFLDESGECGFLQSSSFKHFVIAVVAIDDTDNKMIKRNLKQVFKKFIKRGWYKTKEIKAYDLYKNRKFGAESVKKVIRALLKIKSLEISYLAVNKEKINNESFRKASYGRGYNYFTGVLLSKIIFKNNYTNLFLIYDVRNKETHNKMHFNEYLKTKIYGTALEKGASVELEIE